MRNLVVLVTFVLLIGLPSAGSARAAGELFDLQKLIDDEVAKDSKEIVIPPGVYRVKPHDRVHLRLEGLRDTVIVAKGVTMICTETTQAISIGNCRNLTLQGLSIDYDPLPFTQGRITALGPEKSWAEFELFNGYPENVGTHVEIFDGRTEQLKSRTHYGWREVERIAERTYRIKKSAAYAYDPESDREEVGDIMVVSSDYTPGGYRPHAIVSTGCENLRLEDVTLYASNCFSFFEVECDNSTYLRCALKPRPLGDDIKPRGLRRIRSGNADAFHSKYARRGPQLIDCVARFQGDDCVNICGEYFMTGESAGNTVRVFLHRPLNIEVGALIEIISYDGTRLPDATVVAIQEGGKVTDEERSFIKAQRMDKGQQGKLVAPGARAALLVLDRSVTIPVGSVVASQKRVGNGFLVQGCDFGFNRSRGILIKASNGRIVNNRITSTWGPSILVSPEWWWLEAGSSCNLEIRGNTIKDSLNTAIEITAHSGAGEIAPAGLHRNIAIMDNVFEGCRLPCVKVTSTAGLRIEGNTWPSGAADGAAVVYRNCSGVNPSFPAPKSQSAD
ncbi:right handed beta helix region [Terrimicrobium sacchariphilum]|uniref:Right handed beta helix region n=1 Tax=Terrimicrobium sacchariphilum TaxID=690879 RepID=A0A146G6Q7_TERSA|nr:right-handed parallel beta-helix repeat-containing protein [Terrimicrobium sacchariphilum]GAT33053.1 right handed beta helix region [Terrimicrobium sacchariphilum]